MNSKISVIIPTYKRPGMLKRAIESVLLQTYQNIEIIVVDDNSENTEYRLETEKFMKQYKAYPNIIYLKHKKNKNGAAARNTGIKYSNSKYISFLDDDDEFKVTKLEKQLCFLEKLSETSKIKACYVLSEKKSNGKIIEKTVYSKTGNLIVDTLNLELNILGGSTLLIKKEALEEINYFDESFNRHQDLEMLVRYFKKFEIGIVEEYLSIIHIESNINRPSGEK